MAVEPTRAFDERRPPELDLIRECVHCGFCLPTCPTYVLWGEEMDSPRGRIVLMSEGLEEGSELSAPMVGHFDNCLGCMACVTACPSGVQYDKLIEDTRQQVERNFPRSAAERAYRRMIFELFPHPARLRALAPLLALQRRLGVRGDKLARRFPRLATLQRLAPGTPLRESFRRLPEHTPALGTRRARVGLVQGCVQRVFFGDVNAATVAVLTAEGFEVHAPRKPDCCGALELHAGEDDGARARAKETIAAFEDCDVVAINAAGCGSAMKDYGHLFRDDPEWSERAATFSAKVRDISELLVEYEPVAIRHPLDMRIAYHDACHLAHAQGVRTQPRELLRSIPGIELVEPAEWELCCGSAGVWNLLNPEPAAELGARKARNLLDTGARDIASGNPGCALQIAAHAQALGEPVRVFHPVELLRASLQGRSAP